MVFLLRPFRILCWRVYRCERIQLGKNRLGTGHTDDFCAYGAVEEEDQHGDGLNPVDGSQIGIIIRVHFENLCVAVAGLSDFIQHWFD